MSLWLSTRSGGEQTERAAADTGTVSIGGGSPAVVTGGEQRRAGVFSPGGYVWVPEVGDTVLVIKAGALCEEPCIAGKTQAERDLAAGEICIFSKGASVCLRNSGDVEITGRLLVNGAEVTA